MVNERLGMEMELYHGQGVILRQYGWIFATSPLAIVCVRCWRFDRKEIFP